MRRRVHSVTRGGGGREGASALACAALLAGCGGEDLAVLAATLDSSVGVLVEVCKVFEEAAVCLTHSRHVWEGGELVG